MNVLKKRKTINKRNDDDGARIFSEEESGDSTQNPPPPKKTGHGILQRAKTAMSRSTDSLGKDAKNSEAGVSASNLFKTKARSGNLSNSQIEQEASDTGNSASESATPVFGRKKSLKINFGGGSGKGKANRSSDALSKTMSVGGKEQHGDNRSSQILLSATSSSSKVDDSPSMATRSTGLFKKATTSHMGANDSSEKLLSPNPTHAELSFSKRATLVLERVKSIAITNSSASSINNKEHPTSDALQKSNNVANMSASSLQAPSPTSVYLHSVDADAADEPIDIQQTETSSDIFQVSVPSTSWQKEGGIIGTPEKDGDNTNPEHESLTQRLDLLKDEFQKTPKIIKAVKRANTVGELSRPNRERKGAALYDDQGQEIPPLQKKNSILNRSLEGFRNRRQSELDLIKREKDLLKRELAVGTTPSDNFWDLKMSFLQRENANYKQLLKAEQATHARLRKKLKDVSKIKAEQVEALSKKITHLQHTSALDELALKMERSKTTTKALTQNRLAIAALKKMDELLGIANEKIELLEKANVSLTEQLNAQRDGPEYLCKSCKTPVGTANEELADNQKHLQELDKQFKELNDTIGIWENLEMKENVEEMTDVAQELAKSFTMLNKRLTTRGRIPLDNEEVEDHLGKAGDGQPDQASLENEEAADQGKAAETYHAKENQSAKHAAEATKKALLSRIPAIQTEESVDNRKTLSFDTDSPATTTIIPDSPKLTSANPEMIDSAVSQLPVSPQKEPPAIDGMVFKNFRRNVGGLQASPSTQIVNNRVRLLSDDERVNNSNRVSGVPTLTEDS